MADIVVNFRQHLFHYHVHVSETVNPDRNFGDLCMEQVSLAYRIVAYQAKSQVLLN